MSSGSFDYVNPNNIVTVNTGSYMYLQNTFQHSSAGQSLSYDRLSRLADYAEMEYTPEFKNLLDEITNYIVSFMAVEPWYKNKIYNENLDFYCLVRKLLKEGDLFLFLDVKTGSGVIDIRVLPSNEIKKEEGYDPNNPSATRFRWIAQGNIILENWQCIHIKMPGDEVFAPYGESILEKARYVWKNLNYQESQKNSNSLDYWQSRVSKFTIYQEHILQKYYRKIIKAFEQGFNTINNIHKTIVEYSKENNTNIEILNNDEFKLHEGMLVEYMKDNNDKLLKDILSDSKVRLLAKASK